MSGLAPGEEIVRLRATISELEVDLALSREATRMSGLNEIRLMDERDAFNDAHRWRDVNEEMPEEGAEVLVSNDGMIEISFYNQGDYEWDAVDGGVGITHWMPLPESPEDED